VSEAAYVARLDAHRRVRESLVALVREAPAPRLSFERAARMRRSKSATERG